MSPALKASLIVALVIGIMSFVLPMPPLVAEERSDYPDRVVSTQTLELQPGDETVILLSDRAIVVDLENPPVVATRNSDSREQATPACVHWRESKGFLQIKNDCSTNLNLKVYWEHAGKPSGDTGCHSVLPGTQHNIGFIGFPPMKKNVQRVVICNL